MKNKGNCLGAFYPLSLKWSLPKTPSNSPLRGRMPAHWPLLRLVRRTSLPFQGKGWGWGHYDVESDSTS
jgi:hypothetical protein